MHKKWRLKATEDRMREDDITAAYKIYVSRLRDVRELFEDKRQQQLIEKYKARKDELERAAEILKTAVRLVSVIGKKTIAIADENAVVEVLGMAGQARYSAEQARELWPQGVLDEVMVVDPIAVKRAIDDGRLSEKMANSARVADHPVTPRVSIKVLYQK